MLLNKRYIIYGNKRYGDAQHFDKTNNTLLMAKTAGGARGGSTALATETAVSPLVGSWWRQGIPHVIALCMFKKKT